MPIASPSWEGLGVGCLLPLAYCLPLLGGVRGGLPIASCLLPSPPGRG
ncbi:MAG: hypothetical protein F6K56_36190 [Moorea sp. SIO3G5]|nr:hypothetical protein [Moorena sp. SIO3G5]